MQTASDVALHAVWMVLLTHTLHGAQITSVETVAARAMNEVELQVDTARHTRALVGVGGEDSKLVSAQWRWGAHTQSLVMVACVTMYVDWGVQG